MRKPGENPGQVLVFETFDRWLATAVNLVPGNSSEVRHAVNLLGQLLDFLEVVRHRHGLPYLPANNININQSDDSSGRLKRVLTKHIAGSVVEISKAFSV